MPPEQKTPSILFVEKVFLRKRKNTTIRGVELFNLYLIRDLLALGHPVTLVADQSWKEAVEQVLGDEMPDCVWVSGTGIDFVDTIRGVWKLGRRTFDVLLLGNVGNSLVPAIASLRKRKSFERCVLIAHREASDRFVEAMTPLQGHVLAVNGQIAQPFINAGHPNVHVDYGIMNADQYTPRSNEDGTTSVRFCVIGMLDNAWKGSDTAVAAFRKLPEDIRERCELHLYSFSEPPSFPDENITAYPWMDAGEVPGVIQSMDVMIVPSRDEVVMRETFSQAVVQGMLCGLPVIVSDRPILVEKLDQGGGMVFHDESELVDSIAKLSADAAMRSRLGREGRKTALERYVWDTKDFAAKYLQG